MAAAGDKRLFKNALTYGTLIAFGATLLLPFVWTVSTSLKRKSAIFEYPPRFIPTTETWRSDVPAADDPTAIRQLALDEG